MLLAALLAPALAAPTDSVLNRGDRPYTVSVSAELGALAVPSHRIQFSKDGTLFDFVADGGQDNLFPYSRFSADLGLGERNHVVFLYQPLDLRSRSVLVDDLVVDGLVFPAGTPMDYRYGFSFVRASWVRDLLADPERSFELGVSLQIRNAAIDFASADGTLARSNRDVGPVPILKVRGRGPLGDDGWWIGGEADGFYAPIKYLNGDTNDVVGAILDASVQAGVTLPQGMEPFVSLRYVGGGGEGTSSEARFGDGYVENWLHVTSLSLGVALR